MKFTSLTAAAAIALAATGAHAQTSTTGGTTSGTTQQRSSTQDRIGEIFGALFGNRGGTTTAIEAEWAAGRTPLFTQRAQFEARVDADIRSRVIDRSTGDRLKYDYYQLVQLESRYGADGRFTTQERRDLADRYNVLTQALTNGNYGDGNNDDGYGYDDDVSGSVGVADGQAEFLTRVNGAVSARRITRTEATRLRTDYAALVRAETLYMRDGRLTAAEREELESGLDALDARLGDGVSSGGTVLNPRARLDAIARALPVSGLSANARSQILVEHGDLVRLEAAYARLSVTSDDRAYLDRRLTDLETRARVRR